MLTVMFIVAGVIALIGLVYLVMSSGNEGGRLNQSGTAAVGEQESAPKNSVRTSGGAND